MNVKQTNFLKTSFYCTFVFVERTIFLLIKSTQTNKKIKEKNLRWLFIHYYRKLVLKEKSNVCQFGQQSYHFIRLLQNFHWNSLYWIFSLLNIHFGIMIMIEEWTFYLFFLNKFSSNRSHVEHFLNYLQLQLTIFQKQLFSPPVFEERIKEIWLKVVVPGSNELNDFNALTAFTSATVTPSMAAISSDLLWSCPLIAWAVRSANRPVDVAKASKTVTFNCSLARLTSFCATDPTLSALTALSTAYENDI